MEQMFAARDYSAPHLYRRVRRRRGRSTLIAALLAGAGTVVLAGVAYGGGSAPQHRVTVQAGQTLWGIADAHYSGSDVEQRVADIETANHLRTAAISPGEILILPGL
ncbi:MAG: LysM peptidoglycan-binding domain-containing protein [Candidatus Dormibacteraeota bacterium]|nr:LysM peptidoglycan-binding domain-containing protein [Candidatus Dormibacteraeota bacterium]